MTESTGMSRVCPALKSFYERMSVMLCQCNSPNKYRRLDPHLEKKMVEALKKKASSGQNTFRSINSIILRFPQLKEGLRNIRGVFEQYDEDSDGSIDRDELKKCLDKLQLHVTEKELQELFQAFDVDENEDIQFNEFIVLLCVIYLLMEPSSPPYTTSKTGSEHEAILNTIVEAFLFLDKNGDGRLNKKELVKALNEGSPLEKSPSHITNTRFKEMDGNKSGKVSFKEFVFALINWVGIIDTDNEE